MNAKIIKLDFIDYEDEDRDNYVEGEEVEGIEFCCSGCMKCLGLSWRDFM